MPLDGLQVFKEPYNTGNFYRNNANCGRKNTSDRWVIFWKFFHNDSIQAELPNSKANHPLMEENVMLSSKEIAILFNRKYKVPIPVQCVLNWSLPVTYSTVIFESDRNQIYMSSNKTKITQWEGFNFIFCDMCKDVVYREMLSFNEIFNYKICYLRSEIYFSIGKVCYSCKADSGKGFGSEYENFMSSLPNLRPCSLKLCHIHIFTAFPRSETLHQLSS